MNIEELVELLKTQCVWVGEPSVTKGSRNAGFGVPQLWVVPVIEIAPEGKYSAPRNFAFTVFNVGVVAGPQTYANDVFDDAVDPPVLIHAAGDPILDESGVQVVIPTEGAENVLVNDRIASPVADTLNAVTYLETQKALGTWQAYVEDPAGPKRPDLGFFIAFVFVPQPDGSVIQQRILVDTDSNGDARHTVIA